jgi:hypothetical protein
MWGTLLPYNLVTIPGSVHAAASILVDVPGAIEKVK